MHAESAINTPESGGAESPDSRGGADALPRWTTTLLATGLIVAAVGIAYANRLLVDDAYISFRYAQNLVERAGLVYNPGERVEGYTNFLWVMLIAGGMGAGFAPGTVAYALGLGCYAGTLGLTWRMARRVLADPRWCAAAVVLVGTQFSVFTFATGGLETSLQTCLLAAGCTMVLEHAARRDWRLRNLVALSVICAAGMLTRLDFALFAAVLLLKTLGSSRTTGGTHLVRSTAALLIPLTVIVGAWLLWTHSYYGDFLPNTYYAKQPGPDAIAVGLSYLRVFFGSYWYWVPGVFVIVGAVALIRRRDDLLIAPVIVALWLVYLVRMGGDFIEFRMLVPVMPLFMLTLVWTLRWLNAKAPALRRAYVHVLVIALTIGGSIRHMATYTWAAERPEPVSHLAHQTGEAGWIQAGKALHEYFPNGDVVIATTAAGALPYYAQLPTVDMLGLNDREVAQHGAVVSSRPGHQRLASLEYMRSRKVNLLIGHPTPFFAKYADAFLQTELAGFAQVRRVPPGGVIVFIPIGEGLLLPVWYMSPCAAVDTAIEKGKWLTVEIGVAL